MKRTRARMTLLRPRDQEAGILTFVPELLELLETSRQCWSTKPPIAVPRAS